MLSAPELVKDLTGSSVFARSRRHADLLQFLVEHGESGELKETVIGCEFFGRPADYSPKTDPVVRVEMRRLRERIAEYYRQEGAGAAWRLDIPKGSYQVQVVESASPAEQPADSTPAPATRARYRRWPLAFAAGSAVLVLGAVALLAPGMRTPTIDSIAVLPLTPAQPQASPPAGSSLSGAVTNALTCIGGLRVVGPDAAARAQAKGVTDLAELARRLDVSAMLSGEWIVDGSRMRVQLRLFRGADGQVIWARTLRCDLANVFDIQDEIASSVATAIHRDLLRKPGAARPVVPEALFAFERGNLEMARRSAPAIRQALGDFESSVALDPGFSAAWAALADGLCVAPDYFPGQPGWADRARAAGRRAIDLEPDNADAYAALGCIEFEDALHASTARRLLERAAAINPNQVAAQRRLGLVLMHLRQFKEAGSHLEQAVRLDPLSDIVRINLAELHFYRGDLEAEQRDLASVLSLNPHLMVAQVMLARAHLLRGNCAAVLEETSRLLPDPDSEGWRATLTVFRARCGDEKAARLLQAAADPRIREEGMCLAAHDGASCRAWLERMAQEQSVTALDVLIGPDGPRLRQDPVLQRLFESLDARLRRP